MLYTYLWYFFVYSSIGWILETVVVALHRRKFVNRGVLAGPLCCRYGIFMVMITVFGRELHGSWFFLLIGSSVIAGFVEWTSGRLLEKVNHKKWWDYSKEKYNLDGYTSLRSAVLNGIVGVVCLHYVNPLLKLVTSIVPTFIFHVVLLCGLAVLAIDIIWTYCAAIGVQQKFPQTEIVEHKLSAVTHHLGIWILQQSEKRLQYSYPLLKEKQAEKKETTVFAEGCSFAKLFWLFLIGAFLGDITETIYCRITAGVWMSRSSVVWGPFSIVWGLAVALATLILYNYRDRSDGQIFAFGTIIGGVYEYVCSVFTEVLFGQVFWDYSEMPFNLGGRINLLYCFFWGIAAVIWLKKLYPILSSWIEKIPIKIGKVLTVILVIFMIANVSMSALALARSGMRAEGIPARNGVEVWLDDHYGDSVMKQIYPNSKSTK